MRAAGEREVGDGKGVGYLRSLAVTDTRGGPSHAVVQQFAAQIRPVTRDEKPYDACAYDQDRLTGESESEAERGKIPARPSREGGRA